jgi:hypothetical protein
MQRNVRNGWRVAAGAALVLALPLSIARPAGARDLVQRDLVRETARLALVQEEQPPPTVSQIRAEKEREQAAQADVEKKKVVADAPYYKKWWFWALSAAVVGGTVALGIWAVEPSVQPARACSIGVIGCFGDGRGGTR